MAFDTTICASVPLSVRRLSSSHAAWFAYWYSTAANMVVLAFNHAAQAGKVALDHVGMLAVVAVDFRVVHPINVPARVQKIPVACLVG